MGFPASSPAALVDEVEWVVERRAAGVSAAASEPPPPGTRLVLPERQMRAQEPDDVTWELGVRPGCAPLLRLHGDEYLVERA
jgi:hypothetical protein